MSTWPLISAPSPPGSLIQPPIQRLKVAFPLRSSSIRVGRSTHARVRVGERVLDHLQERVRTCGLKEVVSKYGIGAQIPELLEAEARHRDQQRSCRRLRFVETTTDLETIDTR